MKSKEYVMYFYYSVKISYDELYEEKLNMYFSFPVTLTPKEKEKEPEKE